jgi:hypothetical protein
VRRGGARALLHFLMLGAALYAAERVLAGPAPPDRVQVSAPRREALVAQWVRRTGRAPSPAELAAEIGRFVDEEIWVREALALGLHHTDPVVRARLARNLHFLRGREPGETGAVHREALALGMAHSDPVVRRRLAERMRRSAEATAAAPGEEALRAHYAQHRERFRSPPRVRLRHVFLDPARRGAALAADAAALHERLAAGSVAPGDVIGLGDPFLLGHDLPGQTRGRLAARFGDGFAAAAFDLAPGTWSAPVRSSYGLHLIRVEERVAGAAMSYAAARPALHAEVLADRRRAALGAVREQVQRRYAVEVAATPPPAGTPISR